MFKLKKVYLVLLVLGVTLALAAGCNFDNLKDGEENEPFDPERHSGYVSFKLDGVLKIFHNRFEDCGEHMTSIVPAKNLFLIDVCKYNTNEKLKISLFWQGENAGKVSSVSWEPIDMLGDYYTVKGDDFVVTIDNFQPSSGVVTGTFSGHVYKDATEQSPAIEITDGFFYIKNDFTLPTVTIQKPAAGASVSGQVTIEGTADDDNEVRWVQVCIKENFGEGNYIVDRTDAEGTYDWSFTFDSRQKANGEYTVSVYSIDSQYNYSLVEERTMVIAN